MSYIFDRVENNVGKGKKKKNDGYQHFLLSQKCFQKPNLPELFKVGIML